MAVVFIGGMLLDTAIKYGILEMGEILSPTGPLGIGVIEIWRVVRDILNILFIFGLIYVGISTILDSHKSETQRTLGHLIIAALFVNFSLYATQVVIDFTNILAVQVYNQIIGAGTLVTGAVGADSISGAFLNMAGVTSFWGGDTDVLESLTFGAAIFYSLFMMVFLIVAGIVFALGAVLLITRFALLILYMIFSPFMFASWIFPALGHKSEEYWSWGKLMNQALFAPAFLFMLYLSLVVLQRLKELAQFKTTGQFSDMLQSGAVAVDSFSMIMFFALMIVFLFASIKIATSMGIAGAEGAGGVIDSVKKRMFVTAGGATVGLGARVGRATVGRYGQQLAENKDLLDATGKSGWAGRFARVGLSGAKYIGDSSFDARKVNGVGKSLGIGEGAKGGYKSTKEDLVKQEKARAESFGEVDDEDVRVKELKDKEHHLEEDLAELKRKREDASKEDKAVIDILINEKQDEIKAFKEHIIQEKNRRQIGAYADPAYADGTAVAYKEAYDARSKASQAVTEGVNEVAESQKKLAKLTKEENNKLAEVIEREELIVNDKTKSDTEHAEARQRIAAAKKANRDQIATYEKETADAISDQRVLMKESAKAVKAQNKIIKELKKQAQKEAKDQGYAGTLEKSGFFGSAIYGRSVAQDHAAGKGIRKQYKKGRLKEEAKAHGHDDHGGGHDDHGAKGGGHGAPAAGGHH
jgi:hypothetical protein